MIKKKFMLRVDYNSTHFKTSRPGFTLLEVLVAALIVGLGFLAAAQLNTEALKASRSTADSSFAAFLAESLLEDMMNRKFNEVTTTGSPETLGNYMRSWEVENNSPVKNMRTVTVTVKRLKTFDMPVTMTAVINNID